MPKNDRAAKKSLQWACSRQRRAGINNKKGLGHFAEPAGLDGVNVNVPGVPDRLRRQNDGPVAGQAHRTRESEDDVSMKRKAWYVLVSRSSNFPHQRPFPSSLFFPSRCTRAGLGMPFFFVFFFSIEGPDDSLGNAPSAVKCPPKFRPRSLTKARSPRQ